MDPVMKIFTITPSTNLEGTNPNSLMKYLIIRRPKLKIKLIRLRELEAQILLNLTNLTISLRANQVPTKAILSVK